MAGRSVASLLGCAALVLALLPGPSPAAPDAGFAVEGVRVHVRDDVLTVDADVAFGLSDEVEEALSNGVPVTVRIEFRIDRPRRWLWDPTIARVRASYRIRLHALSSQYVVTNLDLGTSRSFPNLAAALDALGRVRGFPLLDRTLLPGSGPFELAVRARLDIEALPAPLRPLAYLSRRWRLASGWFRVELTP